MTTLKARDGYYYTDGQTYGKTIYLSPFDDVLRWKEVPESEIPSEGGEDTELQQLKQYYDDTQAIME